MERMRSHGINPDAGDRKVIEAKLRELSYSITILDTDGNAVGISQ